MEDEYSIPIHIMAGVEQPSDIDEENWQYHPYARAAIAEFVALQRARIMAKLTGDAAEIYSVGFSDLCAYVMLQDTGDDTYSYHCCVMNNEKAQNLRIQTQEITADQKKILNKSVIEWLKTFRFDKRNTAVPEKPLLLSAEVFDSLKNGKMTVFNKAVEKAQGEYNLVINAKMNTLQYMGENQLLDQKGIIAAARNILLQGMEVKEFYHITADELVKNLKVTNVSSSVMQKVYIKLKDLEEAIKSFELNGKKVVDVNETTKTIEIQKKWQNEAEEAIGSSQDIRYNYNDEKTVALQKLVKTLEAIRDKRIKEAKEAKELEREAKEKARKAEEAERRAREEEAREAEAREKEAREAEEREKEAREAEAREKEAREAAKINWERTQKEEARKKAQNRRRTIIIAVFTVVAATAAIIMTKIVIPANYYTKAENCEAVQDYADAIEMYRRAGTYKDSEQKIRQMSILNVKKYRKNDTVYLGEYASKVLDWTVVEISDGHAVLVCNRIIDKKPYEEKGGSINVSDSAYHANEWPRCSLRKWLNNDFLHSAFSNDEIQILENATVTGAGKNKMEGTMFDYVYILSRSEMDNAIKTSWDKDESIRENEIWLRGSHGTNGVFANAFEKWKSDGSRDVSQELGIVPVIWVKTN